MSEENNKSGSLGLSTIVFIVFLILKLTGNIDWSWWWVFSPLWIPITLGSIFIFVVLLIALLYLAFTGKNLSDLF